ncbi:MAG: hypothetical protein LUE23_06700 [Lachnospiraceae bacterium]|nr:hypothetical protein [Lachnospiraceae bacterium]
MTLSLNNYRIVSFKITNIEECKGGEALNLHVKTDINHKSSSQCAVICNISFNRDEEEQNTEKNFDVSIIISALFEVEGMTDKEIRKHALAELLPLARAHIASGMASVGIEPILIPLAKINEPAEKDSEEEN